MVKQAWSSIEDSDVVMVIVDVKKGLDSNLRSVVRKLFDFKSHNNIILVLNKIDLINTFILLPMIEEINKEYSFQKIFMISALKEDGVNNLVDYLASQSKDIEWCYEPDEITDVSYGFM
uniref:Tr-type G domain-containing protein n=1 Tax=Biomphalaria glabrata TaxID=6526 RepID=A0A2C9KJ84_BIOGL